VQTIHPGIEKEIIMAFDVLEADQKVKGKKIVVMEGGKVGLITAEHLPPGNEA
jgi:hypothetical protein